MELPGKYSTLGTYAAKTGRQQIGSSIDMNGALGTALTSPTAGSVGPASRSARKPSKPMNQKKVKHIINSIGNSTDGDSRLDMLDKSSMKIVFPLPLNL